MIFVGGAEACGGVQEGSQDAWGGWYVGGGGEGWRG